MGDSPDARANRLMQLAQKDLKHKHSKPDDGTVPNKVASETQTNPNDAAARVTVGTLEKTKQTLIQAIAKVEAGIKVQEDRIKAGYIEKEVTTIIKGAFTTYKELKEARERTTKILEDAKKAIDESLNDAEEMLALAVLNHVDDYNTTVAKLGGSQLALTEGFKKVEVQIEED